MTFTETKELYEIKNVEIRGEYGEKYLAELLEICDNFVRIKYKGWKNCIYTVPHQYVYYAPFPNDSIYGSNLPELIAGTLVDVFCNSNSLPFLENCNMDVKTKAWWPGIIRKRQGELVVVDVLDLNSIDSIDMNSDDFKVLRKEIIDIECVRIRCESVSFYQRPLKYIKIEIPSNVRDCFSDNSYEADLKRWCGNSVSISKAEDSAHIIVFTNEDNALHKAQLIGKRWVNQWAAKYHLTQQVEDSKNKKQIIFEDEFSVDERLLNFALGEDFSNLKKVSQLPNVISAQLIDQTGKFSLVAKTIEAMKTAREKLEIVERFVEYDKNLLGILISDSCQLLHEIVSKSGIMRLIVVGNDIEKVESRTIFMKHTNVGGNVNKKANVALLSLTGNKKSTSLCTQMLQFAADNFTSLLIIKQRLANSETEMEPSNDIYVTQKFGDVPTKKSYKYRDNVQVCSEKN